jgi:hypothetical protein
MVARGRMLALGIESKPIATAGSLVFPELLAADT